MHIRLSKIRYIGTRREQQDVVNILHIATAERRTFACGVLTDGIGGLRHGAVASRLVNEFVCSRLDLQLAKCADSRGLGNSLVEIVQLANVALRKHQERQKTGPCGTTLLIGIVVDHTFHFVSVGDSLILSRSKTGRLTRLNEPHSTTQNGRSKLTSALLGTPIAAISRGEIQLDGDEVHQFLLSSDGLRWADARTVSKFLGDESGDKLAQIVSFVRKEGRPKQDNLSMILFDLNVSTSAADRAKV